jgi:hypothetical protein
MLILTTTGSDELVKSSIKNKIIKSYNHTSNINNTDINTFSLYKTNTKKRKYKNIKNENNNENSNNSFSNSTKVIKTPIFKRGLTLKAENIILNFITGKRSFKISSKTKSKKYKSLRK